MNPGHMIEWMLAVITAVWTATIAYGLVRWFWHRHLRALVAVPFVIWGALRTRRTARHAALDIAVKRHPAGSKLPGPDHAQVGRWPDEDTGIGEWTPAQMAFIRGDIDELPHD